MYKRSYEEVDKEKTNGYLSNIESGFVSCNGYLLPKNYLKYGEDILDFEVKGDDIYVVSFPKSGTTWTQEMVWCIKNNLDFAKAKNLPISQRYPFLEFTAIMESMRSSPMLNSLDYAREFPGPRFIKSHLPLSLLPRQLQTETRIAKIIYVARDPRDTCLSFYHHHKLFFDYKEDLTSFAKRFVNDNVLWAPYWKHILEFWKIRSHSNILFLTYEQMQNDITSIIKRVSTFLEAQLDEKQIKQLKEHIEFDNMKDNPAVNYEEAVKAMNALRGSDGKFMRSGKSGGYKQEFSEDVIVMFKDWCKKNIEGTNFDMFDM